MYMINAFTVDIEDWFHPSHLHRYLNQKDWDSLEQRVCISVPLIFDILKAKKISATFFILGWIAERSPTLVERIAEEGHEIASHGYYHRQITSQTPDEFKSDLEMSLKAIYNITKKDINGYRAPVFSITPDTVWALDILKESGIKYDSSIFPFKLHPEYGISDSSLEFYYHDNGLAEIPLSCAVISGKRIPCSGGGYFRLYPYKLFKSLMNKVNNSGRNGVFYIHPWEIDIQQPRLKMPYFDKLRHYHNLGSCREKLEKLVEDFEFTSIEKLFTIKTFEQNGKSKKN